IDILPHFLTIDTRNWQQLLGKNPRGGVNRNVATPVFYYSVGSVCMCDLMWRCMSRCRSRILLNSIGFICGKNILSGRIRSQLTKDSQS
ncbi:Uncharacterized protein APZ42_023286, partial [Daphnia magna]